ncbi:MAG: division/cell wall cluster transcriptional repressor MraZ [Solirubrobacterales bacterium]
MAFRGQHEHSLDAKDRLTIPSKLRAQLAEGVVIAASFDECIEIHPASGFAAYAAQVQSGLNPLGAKARMIRRRIHSGAQDEHLDSAGRVKIPKHLIEHGYLSGACKIVGADTHLEVWSPERWAEQSAAMDAEAGAVAEELAEPDWPARS